MAEHKDVPEIKLPDKATDAGYDLAVKESEGFSQGDLEQEAAKAQHRRREQFRDHFNCAIIVGFWFFFLVIMISGAFWGYHLVTPECWHFLSKDELGKIQNMLFSSVLSGVLSVLARNRYL